jgi:hypothetical protein
MDAVAPTVLDIPLWCAPKKAPCPTCGGGFVLADRGTPENTIARILHALPPESRQEFDTSEAQLG